MMIPEQSQSSGPTGKAGKVETNAFATGVAGVAPGIATAGPTLNACKPEDGNGGAEGGGEASKSGSPTRSDHPNPGDGPRMAGAFQVATVTIHTGVPKPGEPVEGKPTTRGQAEICGRLLSACNQCHTLVDVKPNLTPKERRRATP